MLACYINVLDWAITIVGYALMHLCNLLAIQKENQTKIKFRYTRRNKQLISLFKYFCRF